MSSPPHAQALQRDALLKARGDIYAGEIKFVKDMIRCAPGTLPCALASWPRCG